MRHTLDPAYEGGGGVETYAKGENVGAVETMWLGEGRSCSVGGEGGGEGRKGCTQMKTTMETRGEEWGWWEGGGEG